MGRRLRAVVAPSSLALLLAFGLGAADALQTAWKNAYFSEGFYRSVVFELQHAVSLFLPFSVSALAVIAAASLIQRRSGRARRLVHLLLAAGPALAFFLRRGYTTNRFHFAGLWTVSRRQVAGLDLPEALFLPQVWKANLWVTSCALIIGLGIWLALRRIPHSWLRRLWQVAGSPGIAVLALLAVALPSVAARLLRRNLDGPSFILVSLDTLRADHLGLYGYARDTSPELDRLAKESAVFDWAISQAPNTPLSHMSLFTSAYPTVHGFRGQGDQLAGWWLTLAEYLREAGYRTVATTDGGLMRGWYGFSQGFERYEDSRRGLAKSADLALHWLDDGLAREPFFMFVHTYDIHSPYDPPPPFRNMFADAAYGGGFTPGSQELEEIRLRLDENPEMGSGLSPSDLRFIVARYDEGIRATDSVLGRFVEALRSRGVLDRSWLIVISDHGEEFTEHGSVLHEKLYHTVTHVPLLIRPPGGKPVRARAPEVVELIDVMPTILQLAGVEPRAPLQGKSLVKLLKGDPAGWDNVAYSEHPWFGKRLAMTTSELHVITSVAHGELEVYRYRDDPLEERACDDPGSETEGQRLLGHLFEWRDAQERLATGRPDQTEKLELDDKARRDLQKELRDLGYIR
jgi:arylsulfatase A-like enzyme